MRRFVSAVAVYMLAAVVFGPATGQAAIVTVALDVDPNSATSGSYTTGDLVEVTVRASSDGASGQGFSGGDFGSGSYGVSVDGTYLKIHDILFLSGQVDTEADANNYNGTLSYFKADDTWVYNEFTDFVAPDPNLPDNIILTDTSMRVIPAAHLSAGFDLGRTAPIEFIHIVLEVQAGLTPNTSSAVTFYGQMGAYGVASQKDIHAVIFGSASSDPNNPDIASGSFDITNIPEPASLALLLAGSAVLAARRRRSSS